jgi:hypothetical protein
MLYNEMTFAACPSSGLLSMGRLLDTTSVIRPVIPSVSTEGATCRVGDDVITHAVTSSKP